MQTYDLKQKAGKQSLLAIQGKHAVMVSQIGVTGYTRPTRTGDEWEQIPVNSLPMGMVRKVRDADTAGMQLFGQMPVWKSLDSREVLSTPGSFSFGGEREVKPQVDSASIQSLLTQCVGTIETLAASLEDAQVRTDSLWFHCGRSYKKYRIACEQLCEQGLIIIEGKSISLTALGLECRIGVHTNGTKGKNQMVRFTDTVLEYIDFEKGGTEMSAVKRKVFTSPDGKRTKVDNLRAFCREHNLIAAKMLLVLNGTAKSHHGWTLAQ